MIRAHKTRRQTNKFDRFFLIGFIF